MYHNNISSLYFVTRLMWVRTILQKDRTNMMQWNIEINFIEARSWCTVIWKQHTFSSMSRFQRTTITLKESYKVQSSRNKKDRHRNRLSFLSCVTNLKGPWWFSQHHNSRPHTLIPYVCWNLSIRLNVIENLLTQLNEHFFANK